MTRIHPSNGKENTTRRPARKCAGVGAGIFLLTLTATFGVEPCRYFKFQTNTQFDQSLTREEGVREQHTFTAGYACVFP